MKSDLIKLLDEVHDEKSFLKFVDALIADRIDEIEKEKIKPSSPYGAGPNGWENVSTERYLEAATAWARSMNFGRARHDGKFNDNCWNQFAHFLYAGKIYE
jgi:hypothetical protein